jgi:hypothetical protein
MNRVAVAQELANLAKVLVGGFGRTDGLKKYMGEAERQISE